MACRCGSEAHDAVDGLALDGQETPAYTTDELQALLDTDVDIPAIPATYLFDTE